jgi:uncharacterized membrane protein SpoIIM required for sporulation
MDLTTFLQHHRDEWKRLEDLLERAEGSGLASLEEDQVVELGRLYRRAASDLNQAQTFVRGEATERYLNDLVARAYVLIHGRQPVDWWGLVRYFVLGYPAVFRRNLGAFGLAFALLAAGAVFGFLASWYDRDVARVFLLPADMPTIKPEGEGDADSTPLQTTGEFVAFSSHLFTNNLRVSLFAFALGITLGIGSAWLMFYNGVLLGALAAVFAEAHQWSAFAAGVLPHGVLEIPAAVLGGAAGFVLAGGILRVRPWPRRQELARTGREALYLVSGCVPLLVAAAVLEAGVARAPDWFLGRGLKLAVAGVVGLLFLAYVALPGWRVRNPRGIATDGEES